MTGQDSTTNNVHYLPSYSFNRDVLVARVDIAAQRAMADMTLSKAAMLMTSAYSKLIYDIDKSIANHTDDVVLSSIIRSAWNREMNRRFGAAKEDAKGVSL